MANGKEQNSLLFYTLGRVRKNIMVLLPQKLKLRFKKEHQALDKFLIPQKYYCLCIFLEVDDFNCQGLTLESFSLELH